MTLGIPFSDTAGERTRKQVGVVPDGHNIGPRGVAERNGGGTRLIDLSHRIEDG